jgi:hypothetical protein
MWYGDPEQMGNWSSRPRVGAFRSKSPIEMSRGGTPQAISSESSAEKHFAASRNDDGLFIKQASVNVEPTSNFRFVADTHSTTPSAWIRDSAAEKSFTIRIPAVHH